MPDHFIAEIHLIQTQTGKRLAPLLTGEWRSVLGIGEEHWSARLTFADNPSPGDTFLATVELLIAVAIQHFPIGTDFTVWVNGNKGTGRVLSVAA